MSSMPLDDIKIYPPDHKLHAKIGFGKLDQLLSADVVAEAQKMADTSSDRFETEGFVQAQKIKELNNALQKDNLNTTSLLQEIISNAFALKTNTHIGGYDLVAALSKSLQIYCEKTLSSIVTPKDLEVIHWHATSIDHLLQQKLKGNGGLTGIEIIAQLKTLGPRGVWSSEPR